MRAGTAPVHAWTSNIGVRAANAARKVRGRHLLLLDLTSIAIAIYLALWLRSDGSLEPVELIAFLPTALLPLAVRPIVNDRFGLYRRLWGHASVPDLTQILWAMVVGTTISLAIFTFVLIPLDVRSTAGFPRSFWILELLLSLSFIGGTRFFIRALNDVGTTVRVGGATVSMTPALLFGAGRAGVLMARSARHEPRAGVHPVGFLDEDPARKGVTVDGLPVFGGLESLDEAIRRTGAKMLLITMPNASGPAIRRVMDRSLAAGLDVRTVPAVHELLDGSWDALRVRQVRVEDLLTRPQVTIHAPGVASTIGSELARQVYSFGPKRLVLVDRAESPLYLIQRELELRRTDGRGSGELSVHLANVASRAVISRLINETTPAVIFHAAACKHVPMMEEHPSEGVQVNVGGTSAVLNAAVEAGVPRFVLVSTDKAVEPSSVMGATKRLAEWLVADAAARTGRPYVAVRFGNVLGSAGSVLPIFQSQLEHGEPITITDPEMTRFFMTITEAGWLILDAAAIGQPGDLFVLDMGEPVKIVDMVNDLIRLSGRDIDTVPIRITGLRPGEKLHEQLFYDTEIVEHTDVERIFRVKDSAPPSDVRLRASRLLQLALGEHDDQLRSMLFDAVSSNRSAMPDVSVLEPAPVARSSAARQAIATNGQQPPVETAAMVGLQPMSQAVEAPLT
jgi:FlaA1/EpsC-like NDP-sugar epimerase